MNTHLGSLLGLMKPRQRLVAPDVACGWLIPTVRILQYLVHCSTRLEAGREERVEEDGSIMAVTTQLSVLPQSGSPALRAYQVHGSKAHIDINGILE